MLVLSGFGGSLATKDVFINNQPCIARPTLIDEIHCSLFAISLHKCDGSYNTVEDPFGRICVPNKIEDVNLKMFIMIKGIHESQTLIKHILCECRCEFDGRQCNLNQQWNNDKCQCECKKPIKHCICEEHYA